MNRKYLEALTEYLEALPEVGMTIVIVVMLLFLAIGLPVCAVIALLRAAQ